ncbi:HAD family phosphatase [Companilactobacillus zhachilii]|uniref:HAD family phosphatase n=1 Tax=Companilactobacillus zhachilii TaxID=2304606 RepID=A0A386PQS4_9LACO|nr:Cof-type HAD-IIB family hydrolase [Companilactobacillus zhachilii]AYE37652.1 HAD family phosphatase [Companilactobacillus zhachilii]
MIKHIFSDMDGTLLQSNCKISENTIKTIKESQIPFTLVSARSPQEMVESIADLELHEPQIAFNGGLIFQQTPNGKKVLQETPINPEGIKQVLTILRQDFPDISCSLYDLENWYIEKVDKGIEYEAQVCDFDPVIVDFVSLLKQTDLKIFKIMLISFDDAEMKALNEKLQHLNKAGLAVTQSARNYLEITDNLAKKSRGVQYIQELEELAKDDLAAFGDGYNDLVMLKQVGTPIVMDNALPGVKEYAKYVTKDNDNDGVAYGILNYLTDK